MYRLTGLLLILFVMVLVGTVNAGAWVIETVDSTGRVGLFTSIAVDSSGNPHISYFDESNRYLKGIITSNWTFLTAYSVGILSRFYRSCG